ncbi:MAG: PKD domain-containing protein [Gemmatimonadaceae bacterium]
MRKRILAAAVVCGVAACSDLPSANAPASTIATVAATRANLPQTPSTPIPGRYIVQFRASSTNTLAKNAAVVSQMYGGTVERVYTTALNGAVMQLSDAGVAALRNDSRVLSVEQDQVFSVSAVQNSPPSWGLDRIDQRARPLSQTYGYSVSGNGVTAYIIDTGINFAQADFGGRAVTGYDAITAGGNAQDCNGHGTHTAGTVGATTYGVAKKVRLVAVRVMNCVGNGSTSSVIAGVDWVTQHVSRPAVANMSLGGNLSPALNTAVENSILAGVTYAVSAGNSSADACNQSPAAAPNVISVGATGSADDFASFSNFGSCVHINAPGVGITSLWIGASGTTTTISGTSMASPHVAGVAALYLEANPTATPAQVRSALTSNATANVITSLPASTPNLLLYEGFIGGTPPVPPVAPIARFTSSCAALTCSFNATATTAQPAASYSWNFGDGSTATGMIVSRTYAASGTYNATLTVSDAGGTITKTRVLVVTGPAVNQAPSATIATPALNATTVQGTSISFAGSATDPEDGSLSGASLVWTSSRDGQIGTGTSFAKANLSTGTHTITLTATDSKGSTATATRTITISAANQAPVASFTWNCATGITRQCALSGSGSTDDVGITMYTWDWGNGRSESHVGAGAKNTWTPSGTYNVTLKVTDGSGLTNSVTKTVIVP